MNSRHLSLVGTTASGKSSTALAITRRFPGVFELVSVDSMQVYRGMDIGTAKPTMAEQAEVAHHVIDLVGPGEDFTLQQFQSFAREALTDIESRGKRAILVGGTGLYLQSVLDDLDIPPQFPQIRATLEADPDTAAMFARLQELDPLSTTRMDSENRRRVVRALEVTLGSGRPFSSFGPGMDAFPANPFRQIGLWLPREVGARRIEDRVQTMVDGGWIDEVDRLRQSPWSRTARQALGYPEWQARLEGSLSYEDAFEQVVIKTRGFARRQRMWFRRDPRITWFGTSADPGQLVPAILRDCEHWLRDVREREGGELSQ